jgi:hypothetical protein
MGNTIQPVIEGGEEEEQAGTKQMYASFAFLLAGNVLARAFVGHRLFPVIVGVPHI